MLSVHVSQAEGVRSGEKCLSGSRLTIVDVVSLVIQGEKADYHQLTDEQIDACLIAYFSHSSPCLSTSIKLY